MVALDASTAELPHRIKNALARARDTHEAVKQAHPDHGRASRVSGLGVGPVSVRHAIIEEMRPDWDVRDLLTALAEAAGRENTSVLLTLDELQSGDRDELRRFSSDLQYITKREQLPLAVVSAGLSEMKHTLLLDKKLTFFRRCAKQDMPALSQADVMEGLHQPVRDAGGTFDRDALRLAVGASGPLPYKLQLIGDNAWKIAGAPSYPIDAAAVEDAIAFSEASFVENVVVPAWSDLSDGDQDFLIAVAELGENATKARVAKKVDAHHRTLKRAAQRLQNCCHLDDLGGGRLRLTETMPSDFVLNEAAEDRAYFRQHATEKVSALSDASAETPAPARRGRRVCGEYMPVAKATCVLPHGHAGGHRSTRPARHQPGKS